MSLTESPRRRHALRVLVLSADVGEGHVAAARALSEGLRALGTVDVVQRDGLWAFGAVTRHLIRDGYRWQLHWAPWTYATMYWLFTRLAPARAVGALVLAAAGQRRLRRIVRREQPDVVVTTHPALTCVLGRMRLRRKLVVPLCAVITDLADYRLWSHRGADLHLVMHEHGVAPVERFAGAGSAALVRPLVATRFLEVADRETARGRLGLRVGGRLVAVSGGGWGVGDLSGAVDAALACDDAEVVVLAGRNEVLRATLVKRYEATPRVHVWGFTERMDELLRAADVAVHSTGGVTSLEALSCGCPLIGYGSSIGHIRVHNRTMAALGLITLADTRAQLAHALRGHLADAPARRAPLLAGGADAATALLAMPVRVRPLPRWRVACGPFAVCLAAAAAVLVGLSTDDAYSLAARPLDLRPTAHVATTQPDVALIVRAPQPAVPRLAHALAARGLHASFAVSRPLAPGVQRTLARLGDDSLPVLTARSRVRWLETREQLRGTPRFGADRRYLVPASGLSLGQYLLARSVDASPVTGRMSFSASGSPPIVPSAGDIVVVTADGSAGRTVSAAASLRVNGLGVVALSTLLDSSSTSARTARAAVSATAPPITTASPRMIPAGPSGARAQLSPTSSGAARTGITTWTTKTSGATCVAGRRCNADISLTMASPELRPVASVHTTARSHSCALSASATNFVESPPHANAAPAERAAAMPPTPRRPRSAYGVRATPARAARAPASGQPPTWCEDVGGATAARKATPAMIAPTASMSRAPTRSSRVRAPSTRSSTRPKASAGCTTVSGASSSAAACSGQPTTPSAVPASQRGRRANCPSRDGRSA
jgi:processive 1,2-diacylglycerol beta-glucosyltransferase